MPTWRWVPPIILRRRRAAAMTGPLPASTAPTGALRPFDRHSDTVSTWAARSAGGTPRCVAALNRRAPSRWTGIPRAWARSATAAMWASGRTVPPAALWEVSSAIMAVRSGLADGCRASSRRSRSMAPSVPGMPSRNVPVRVAAPRSVLTMWAWASSRTCSLRWTWARIARRLPIVQLGTNRPDSLPRIAAAVSSSSRAVGSASSPSSPSGARAHARVHGLGGPRDRVAAQVDGSRCPSFPVRSFRIAIPTAHPLAQTQPPRSCACARGPCRRVAPTFDEAFVRSAALR